MWRFALLLLMLPLVSAETTFFDGDDSFIMSPAPQQVNGGGNSVELQEGGGGNFTSESFQIGKGLGLFLIISSLVFFVLIIFFLARLSSKS